MKKMLLIASILYNLFTLGIYNINILNVITILYITIYAIIFLVKYDYEKIN